VPAKTAPATGKTKIRTCPTCGDPLHRDPVTKRYTRHPEPAPEKAEIIPPEPEKITKRRLFGRNRNA
jgi:hypothetical protein